MILIDEKSSEASVLSSSHINISARELADQYFYGEGKQQDLTEALRWYLIAAENGDQIAQRFLTICLENLELDLHNIETLNTADWFATKNIQ